MNFKEGYVYHINDSYFAIVNDEKLMKNRENGTYRPTFFCMKDKKHDTRNGQPVPVKHSIVQEVHSNMQKLRQFIYSGRKNVVFPDIIRLEKLMLAELKVH